MHHLSLPLWGAVLLTIFFFCVGMWEIALLNIASLVVQVLGALLFDWDTKTTGGMFIIIIAIGVLIISCM